MIVTRRKSLPQHHLQTLIDNVQRYSHAVYFYRKYSGDDSPPHESVFNIDMINFTVYPQIAKHVIYFQIIHSTPLFL